MKSKTKVEQISEKKSKGGFEKINEIDSKQINQKRVKS